MKPFRILALAGAVNACGAHAPQTAPNPTITQEDPTDNTFNSLLDPKGADSYIKCETGQIYTKGQQPVGTIALCESGYRKSGPFKALLTPEQIVQMLRKVLGLRPTGVEIGDYIITEAGGRNPDGLIIKQVLGTSIDALTHEDLQESCLPFTLGTGSPETPQMAIAHTSEDGSRDTSGGSCLYVLGSDEIHSTVHSIQGRAHTVIIAQPKK